MHWPFSLGDAELVAAIDFDARSAGAGCVTVIHHMVTEEPRIIFLHFWTNDDALKLARGLRAALDKTASAGS
jgi:hypothetical protein